MGKVFSKEFRDQIVELHRVRRQTMASISREFNLSATTVANWVRAADQADGVQRGRPAVAAPAQSDSERIAFLERELAKRNEDLEILGKALAFFARRSEL